MECEGWRSSQSPGVWVGSDLSRRRGSQCLSLAASLVVGEAQREGVRDR